MSAPLPLTAPRALAGAGIGLAAFVALGSPYVAIVFGYTSTTLTADLSSLPFAFIWSTVALFFAIPILAVVGVLATVVVGLPLAAMAEFLLRRVANWKLHAIAVGLAGALAATLTIAVAPLFVGLEMYYFVAETQRMGHPLVIGLVVLAGLSASSGWLAILLRQRRRQGQQPAPPVPYALR